jgi:phosphatidylglycerol:prolipoprotein diacylglycerol transferase
MLLRRARRFGIEHAEIAPFYLAILIAGLGGAVIAQLLLSWTRATLEPGLGLASIGALAGGLAAAILVCCVRHDSLRHSLLLLDIAAFVAPFASCVARLGCALAHDHRGLPSDAWYAVRFPEGGRYDLGLLEFAFLAALSALFLILDARRHRPPFFFGLAALLYGAFRLWRETLDVNPHFLPWAVVCVLGAAVWIPAMVCARPAAAVTRVATRPG